MEYALAAMAPSTPQLNHRDAKVHREEALALGLFVCLIVVIIFAGKFN